MHGWTRRGRRWFAGVLLLAACATPLERAAQADLWLEAQVGSFRVVSDLRRERVLQIADRLAVFEPFLRRISNARELAPRVPTLVLALSSGAYAQYLDPLRTAGVFVPSARGNVLFVRDAEPYAELEEVLFHEYGHFALANDAGFSYPTWYHEGHAEMLRSARIDAQYARIGASLPDHLETLARFGLLESEQLFTVRSTAELSPLQRAKFYAQSWLTVLYLSYAGVLVERSGLPDRSGQLQRYLTLVNDGVAPAAAARRAFHADFSELDRELRRFLMQGFTAVRRIPRAALGALPPIALRSLEPAQTAAVLGGAALALEQTHSAERIFARALELDPGDPQLLRGLARSRWLQRGVADDALLELFERALALAPRDPLVLLDGAAQLRACARLSADPGRRARLEQRAQTLLERAAADPTAPPEALLELALVRESRGAPAREVLETLASGYAQLPSDARLALELARRLAAQGDAETARRIATRALAGLHDAAQARELEALLGALGAADPENAAVGAQDSGAD